MNPRLDFSLDTIPHSERENPKAVTSPEWEEIFARCDGEVREVLDGLNGEERRKLAEGFSRILRWVYSDGRGVKQRNVDQAVGRRTIALGLLLCPDLIPGGTQSGMARTLGLSRQALSKLVARAKVEFPTG